MERNTKTPLSLRLLKHLLVGGIFVSLFALPIRHAAQAQVAVYGGPVSTAEGISFQDIGDRAADEAKDIAKKSLTSSVVSYLINLMTFAADKAAYEAAVRVASAGAGGTSLVNQQTWDGYWQDVGAASAGEALGLLSDEISGPGSVLKNFNLCAPGNVSVLLSFKFGIKSVFQKPTPKCDINLVASNWKGFLADVSTQVSGGQARNQRILTSLADAFDPNTNEFSVGIGIQSSVLSRSFTDSNLTVQKRLSDQGFNDATDFITGQVKTPASLITENLKWKFNNQGEMRQGIGIALLSNTDALLQVGVHAGSIFANTLLSKLSEQIFTGLFDVNPALQNQNPFDPSSFAQNGSDASLARLKSIFTATPLEISNFSILSDFSSCPQSNRGLYNCVADSSFISAIARAASGVPVTVQEAMDDGLLKPDWPLIPSGDHARNQDPFCYTYGYCSSNLVKLRKARVISVGWEFAADSTYNSPNDPATLREIVGGFNNCNSAGQPDQDHPWCKLIDPNWVLKYPQTQCRADVNGQLLSSSATSERQDECVDMPSCIAEDENGNCTGGYGYCVREENVWQFRGQTCPKQFASCITVKNSEKTVSYLRNTTDPGPCTEDNAGCQWYATAKTRASDGTFAFPVISSVVAADADPNTFKSRTYFTSKVEECDAEDGGCHELIERKNGLSLNMLINPSFEANTDANTLPDGWTFSGGTPTWDTTSSFSRTGANAIKTVSAIAYQPGVEFSQSRFYTVSFYARQTAQGDTERGQVYIGLNADDGSPIELAGTSKTASANADSCNFSDGNGDGRMDALLLTGTPDGTTYERFSCTFTSALQTNAAARLFAFVDVMPGKAWMDDIQIEQGPVATNFHEGYSSTNVVREVVKVPPSYLGCTGASTDSTECAKYAKVCSENDAGCSAYTPTNGDPVVTGVTSELDSCSATCVGYDTYKQEATRYESSGVFPLYFIPSTAKTCRAQDVGCDEFTSLTDESKAYFTYVRACTTPAQAEANTSSDNAATFYTWEGSDNAGFQLKTWNLLESNLGATPYTHAAAPNTVDAVPGEAPCVHAIATANGITCSDAVDANGDLKYDWDVSSCDEHADIFSNADCREFYDGNGQIHYRSWSNTISVDAACTSYRKTDIAGDTEAARQSTCEGSGGFFDLAAGTCRYFGLASESRTCSVQANGCRAYTGGRSRNSRVAYTDQFEGGDMKAWDTANSASAALSNDSLATGGHSMRITANTATFTFDNGGTCTNPGGCPANSATQALGSGCTVVNGSQYCGTLEGNLFKGKTYTLTFLAKGTGTLRSGFDFKAVDNAWSSNVDFGTVTLADGWQQFSLGPLDMNGATYADFGAGTVLAFFPSGTAFIDNISLREGQDNITLIKNSWVTPAVCDQTPTGTASPQYQLGCQEYSTQEGNRVTVKSFSRLCDEDKVGCASFFMTQESTSPHAEVHNATCGTIGGGVATAATACYYGVTGAVYNITTPFLCTIGVGSVSCPFNLSWYVAPANLPAHVKYVASTVVTPADKDVFLVVTDDVKCADSAAGCTEYGKPTYNQARTATSGATSVYFKNDPSAYAKTLCTQDALFCSQWTGTGGAQYYFKDPGDKTCEYKTNVTVDGTSYDGWFKTGTSEFCYASPDYIIGGSMSGIWKNGDAPYAGWVGTCTSQYNSCAEYQDPLAVGNNEIYGNTDGAAYFSLSASLGSARSSVTGTECNGKVSLKGGCALFNDTSISSKTANTSATEIASRHADALFNAAPFSLVDPLNCDAGPGATTITTPAGTSVDLCAKRCVYDRGAVNDLTENRKYIAKLLIKAGGGTQYGINDLYIFGSSCYMADDCAPVTSESGETRKAIACDTVVSDNFADLAPANAAGRVALPRLTDDANTVLAVNRNRQCSEWLSCADAQTVWDERTNSYKTVCGDIALCTEYSAQGNSSFCSKWNFEDPKTVLDATRYTSRDVTWYGDEYSGFAIPDLYPVQTLKQANVAPKFTCDLTELHDGGFISDDTYNAKHGAGCNVAADCGGGAQFSGTCSGPQGNDFRLVLNAGKCTSPSGTACTVGTCANTGSACAADNDCGSAGGSCMVGQCYTLSPSALCTADTQCGSGQVCSGGFCATPGADVSISAYAGPNNGCLPTQTFVPKVGLKNGTCVNDQCLLAPNGDAFALGSTEGKACRAYPEISSPFTADIVETWLDTATQQKVAINDQPTIDDLPYDTRSGFEHASLCAFGQDCICSYKKVTYGEGAQSRYYNQDYIVDGRGICTTGTHKGALCRNSSECSDDETVPGTCSMPSREDTLLGMDGYCLERDTAINVNGDRDQNACITWLPVDQLAGSSDLFGKSTESGFSQEANYCARLSPFANIGTGEGCVERIGGGGNIKAACINRATTCPPGTYGIVGPYFNAYKPGHTGETNSENDELASSLAKACTVDSGSDNNCPYVCVPIGATGLSGNATASCDASAVDRIVDIGSAIPKDRGDYTFNAYWVAGMESFEEVREAVKSCVATGRRLKASPVVTDESTPVVIGASGTNPNPPLASTFGLTDEGLAGCSTCDRVGWRSYVNKIQAYMACDALDQVQSVNTLSGAPWTDRLLGPNADYKLAVNAAYPSFAYTKDVTTEPFGVAPSASDINARGYPAVVAQCNTTLLDADGEGTDTFYIPAGSPGAYTCSTSSGNAENFMTPDLDTAESRAYLSFNGVTVANVHPSGENYWRYTGSFVNVGVDATKGVGDLLKQIFATSLSSIRYLDGIWSSSQTDPTGTYLSSGMTGKGKTSSESMPAADKWDVRATAGHAPQIWAINPATCKGSECEEGPSNAITVNDQNTGDITSTDFLRASVKFYAAADKNQLPLRRVIVDWGDDENPSGSSTDDNFYKNHRGLQTNSSNSKCDLNTEWGLTTESCDPNYITYSHIYTCPSTLLLDAGASCGTPDANGRYPETPCVTNQGTAEAACVYQPKVHTRDNWGWCGGVCSNGTIAESSPASNGCFGSAGLSDTSLPSSECAFERYPEFNASIDPWIYYDGQVVVKP